MIYVINSRTTLKIIKITIFKCRIKDVRSVIVCPIWKLYHFKKRIQKVCWQPTDLHVVSSSSHPSPVRLVDGEASVRHGPGGAPGEEPPGDRSAPGGLRHDAARDRHEGGGTEWIVTSYCPIMISNPCCCKASHAIVIVSVMSCFLFYFLLFILSIEYGGLQILCYHCDHRGRYNSWSNLNYCLFDCCCFYANYANEQPLFNQSASERSPQVLWLNFHCCQCATSFFVWWKSMVKKAIPKGDSGLSKLVHV